MSVFPLLQCALDEGVALPSLLQGSRLTETLLREPSAMIPFSDELVLVANYLRHSKEVHPGLRASAFYHYNSFGVLGAALVSHPTMLDACRFLVRYVGLTFTPFLVRLQESDTALEVRYLDHVDLGACRSFYLLRDLAFIRNLCREADPDHWRNLISVMEVAMDEPAQATEVRDFFEWPLRFGAEETVIRSSPPQLRGPLRLANAMTLQMMRRQCDDLLAQRQRDSWRQRVETLLLAGEVAAEPAAVAARLCCSERSLRRHLQQEGCTFQEIVLRLQHQRAVHFLRHSRLPVETIATRLGYSETAAFAHAFKRWTGQTPSQFRSGEAPAIALAAPGAAS